MVSAAAKKRQQKKKALRKNQNIQTSKSTTDLNQFLTNDVVLDKEEGSKELGDQELEDLLNEENIENEPAQTSHVKQRSGSNYTFFNDADAKADVNDQDEDLFGDDIDLLLSDDELDLDIDHEDIHPYEAVAEPTNDVSKSVPELEVADNNTRAFSNVSQKGTEVKLEKYASMILADGNDVQELPVPEIDHALNALKDQKDMIPEVHYEENVEIPAKSSVEVDLGNDDDLLDDELDAELQELLDEDIEVPEMDEGVEVANEIPELQEQDEVAEEVPELKEQDEVAEEVPELQEQNEVAEEVPELQEQHEVANKIPELQEQNEVANEIPELQEEVEAVNQIIESEENVEIAGKIPELQENIQTAEIPELDENIELSNDIDEQIPIEELAPPQVEQVIEETQPVLESELSVSEPVASPPTDEIVMEVEQIPDDAVVTAEYSAEEVSPATGSDPISEVLIQDTHEEPQAVAPAEEMNTESIPPPADEPATVERQPEIDDHLSDEDFFNNISAENLVTGTEVHQPEDQKENDQAFFDQLSAPPAMDKPLDAIPKEDISVNIVSVDEPVDDVEFFNNLNTVAKPEQSEDHADEDSLLEDDSILLSDKEGEIPADDEYSEKKDYTNATVVQTPLDKAQSQELIDELIDSDLLDEDSLLDSDEELENPEEQIQPVVEEKESSKKASKYAPTVEAVQPVAVHKTSNVGIEPIIISGNAPTVQPTLNIIKPQIIAPRAATVENQKPPVVTKYKTEKHKSDAYDFPVDLVSNLKPPAKAKAIRTASVPKQSFSAAPVPSEAAAVDAVQAPSAVVPSIPVNPYAAPSVHKSASKKNPYAPQAMSNPSPSLSVQSGNSGIVKPPLNIVSSQPMPGIPTQPHMNNAPPANKPKGPIPASNTDLPFTVAPPKAVPRTKPPVNEPPKNPPINTTRARAVSNVSASSLSAGIYSPSLQNSNAGTFDSASSNFPAGGFNNQRLPSRSGSINKPSSIIGDNKPKNLYAPSFQHIRKNSNASFSPVNHAMGIQNSNVPPTGSPGVHALQTAGLNNANNPLSPITPGTKVAHARSHSSVYAPKKNQGAASKYAPTVHPSVQQAFFQQQMQPPIDELPNAFVAANPVVQNGHSRTSSYIPPVNNAFAPQNGMFVPKNGMMPNQQFVGQQQFGFPNTMNNQPMMSNMPSVENTFVPNNKPVFQQQPPVANAPPFSQFPINTIPVGAPAQTKSVNVLPITNPEELNKRQFPIVRWSASGHVVSLKNSQYQNTTNIKIQSHESVVFLPKHFLDFPGILIRGKTKAKTLQPWLDETCAFINGDSAYDVDGKILWSLLNKKIELMDEKSVDVTQLSKFASVLYDATELNKFIENNKNNGFNHNQFQQQNMAASKLDNEGLAQVLTYLRVGEHSEALSIALKSNDFSMSMVIASLMGKEKWTEVVDLYLKKEFQGSGPDSEFAVNLLSSIFQVYIGNGKSLIEDFESNELKKHWALNNWNIILASVLSNSKPGTDVNATNNMLVGFLVDMGIFLSKNGKSLASDCCFILADVPLSFNEVIPGSNVVFSEIGAPNSLDGMLLSDLYEYCHKSSLPKFSGFLTLIGSKISHAEVLLLQKQYTTANKILDVCTQMNKELIKTGNAQLKYVYTIDKIRTIIDSKSDSWIGKPTLSGVWGTLDKSFNKLIGGDNIDETADDINTGITKSESKLFDTFDAANSRNISAAEANRSFDFSQNIVNNRAPYLQNSNLAVTQSDTNLYTENAHIYQNNKNMLTKNAVGNMKQESSNNMPPGPPSLSSVASSEQFNQQVANNLAKLHSHSRNQSVDSLLSFAPSNQRLTANTNAKRGSTASHTLAQNARSNEFTNNDTVIKKPLKKYGLDNEAFTEADKPVNFFQSAATNKYSPVKKSEESHEVKQAIHDDIQDAIAGDHETDMFLNKDEPVDVAVNSPPKKSYPVGNEQSNVTNDYTFPSDLTFPPMQSQNPSQTTIHNSGPSTESLPVNRKESDFSPHTSMAPPRNGASFENRFNLPADDYSKKAASMSDLPIPQMVKEEDSEEPEFSAPPKMHKTHSSLASPIKTEVLQQDQDVNNTRVLDADFHPPTKPFNSQYINNVKNQNYMPVTPHQQQFNRGYQSSGWVKTHSRSSSQILAEMTGLNNNSQNPNTAIGGSVYTSRNVSIDSNIASSEPVIRQVRSSSVVFTPDSKRRQSEKVMYDDIVEEDEENDRQNSQNEARLIEKRLAAAREQAEKEKERKEKEEKAKKQEDDKSKKTQENGWFGWLKNNNNPNEKKPIKAKLGQKNQFYYDEKLKRWVNKNATEEEKKEIEAEANSAPPPPPVIKKKSVIPETKPRSGSILGGPTQRTMGVMPPKNPITGESLIPEIEPDRASFNNNNIGSIVVQAVPEETESDVNSDIKNDSVEQLKTPGPGRFSSNVSSVNLTSSATGLDDLLSLGTPGPMNGGPPSNFGSRVGTPGASASRRNKKANRGYVNVMDHM